jgi:hypothetical protein
MNCNKNRRRLHVFSYLLTYLLTYLLIRLYIQVLVRAYLPLYSFSNKVGSITSPIEPSVHLDFSLFWFRLLSGMALNGALCGRSSAPLNMCPAKRNLLFFTTPQTFGLSNSLSSLNFYLLLYTPFTTFGPCVENFPFKNE